MVNSSSLISTLSGVNAAEQELHKYAQLARDQVAAFTTGGYGGGDGDDADKSDTPPSDENAGTEQLDGGSLREIELPVKGSLSDNELLLEVAARLAAPMKHAQNRDDGDSDSDGAQVRCHLSRTTGRDQPIAPIDRP